jgi:hypothetical protein
MCRSPVRVYQTIHIANSSGGTENKTSETATDKPKKPSQIDAAI